MTRTNLFLKLEQGSYDVLLNYRAGFYFERLFDRVVHINRNSINYHDQSTYIYFSVRSSLCYCCTI